MRFDNKIRISLGCRSSLEIRELKRKLVSELDQVRSLKKKIEAKESQSSNGFNDNGKNGTGIGGGGGGGSNRVGKLARVNSEVSYVGPTRAVNSPQVDNKVSLLNLCDGGGHVDKEKRDPKMNQKKHSDAVNRKDKTGPEANKKLKPNGGEKKGGKEEVLGFGSGKDRYLKELFKTCEELLEKLMKHQYGWVFNAPVDAKKLKLHDYHKIIKHPMDLGTVNSRLGNNWYKSPKEFADDVRLTFNNAMTYNEKGQDVHFMADVLLKLFEDNWAAIKTQFQFDKKSAMRKDTSLPRPSSKKATTTTTSPPDSAHVATPVPPPQQRPIEVATLDGSDIDAVPVDSRSKTSKVTNTATKQGRAPASKKPTAKDLEKRDMTYEEKQRLSLDLQSLPSDKLDSVVHIIRRRNPDLFQQEDEIEVDIECFDTETLWELDGFLTNYKKSLNKKKENVGTIIPETYKIPTTEEAHNEPEGVPGRELGHNLSGSCSSSSSSDDSRSSSSESGHGSSSGYGSDAGH